MRVALAALVLSVSFPIFAADPVKDELLQLEGTWVQVSVEADGKTLQSGSDAPTLRIVHNEWIEISAAGQVRSTFKIDPTKDPKQIDRATLLGGEATHSVAITLSGIYMVQGDTLTVCTPFPFNRNLANVGKRPMQFHTQPGDPFVTAVYKRVAAVSEQQAPALDWDTDWIRAFEAARHNHRLVFVYYSSPTQAPDLAFANPELQRRLVDFVLVRQKPYTVTSPPSMIGDQMAHFLDEGTPTSFGSAWQSGPPPTQGSSWVPIFAIYDEHEEMLVRSSLTPDQPASLFNIDFARRLEPIYLRAGTMIDSGDEISGDFLVANTYTRMGHLNSARAMYTKARDAAAQIGDKTRAQIAEGEIAFLFARERDFSRAIRRLKDLAAKPVDANAEAMICLMLGNAHRLANHRKDALEAYQRVQTVAAPDSPAYKAAGEAISRMH